MPKMFPMSTPPASQPKALRVSDGPQAMQRLLVPVKKPDDASQSIAYAIRRRAEGGRVQVAMLHVQALVAPSSIRGHGQYIRARTTPSAGSVFFLGARMLEGLDIDFSTYIRSGPVVFSILDAAEQLDCSEIVVPAPGRLHLRLLSRNTVRNLLAWQRSVPVVAVNKRGIKQPGCSRQSTSGPTVSPLAVTAPTGDRR